MQALTRNPLADPGILGVEAGAAAAIVTAIGLLGITQPRGYIWFSFLGAAVASIVVYLLGSHGRAGATPVRLALAGTAVTFALTAYTNGDHAARPGGVRRVPPLGGRLAGRARPADPQRGRAVPGRRRADRARARPAAERARARRRPGARAGRARRAHARAGRRLDHADVRRRHRGRRPDRLRRAVRPAHGARDRRPRPALGAGLLAAARADPAADAPTSSAAS